MSKSNNDEKIRQDFPPLSFFNHWTFVQTQHTDWGWINLFTQKKLKTALRNKNHWIQNMLLSTNSAYSMASNLGHFNCFWVSGSILLCTLL